MAKRHKDLVPVIIREVWADNLEDEFAEMRHIIDKYPYVAVDVQHPGIVHRPLFPQGEINSKSISEYNYTTMKANVDVLKVIQIGLTFSDERGTQPMLKPNSRRLCAWQFNIRGFDPRIDVADADHVDLLRRSGTDLARHATEGVDPGRFAELLISSRVVRNMDLHWVTFHGRYAVGFLLKLLTNGSLLPDTISGFFDLVNTYFPRIHDLKHMMTFRGVAYSGLNGLAEILCVKYAPLIGHKAGSDSFLTALCFNKFCQGCSYWSAVEEFDGVLFGLRPANRTFTGR